MGIDNVLGVAGAASGSFELVALGLMISIPIVMFGSQLVLKLVARWPIIIPLGGAVLAFTSAQMVVNETLFKEFFSIKLWQQQAVWWGVHVVFVVSIISYSWLRKKRQQAQRDSENLEMV
jgi:predicted tellurium resistance membrane protein TerC